MPRNHQQIDALLDALSDEELAALAEDDIFREDGHDSNTRQRASRSRQRVEKLNLETVLDLCIRSRALIKPEQDKIQVLIDKAVEEKEIKFRQYQFDLVAWQLNRAADAAEKRKTYIATIKTQADIEDELARCGDGVKGVLHWFEYYAWAFDPRPDSPLGFQPLVPFEFQLRYLKWLFETIFLYRTGGLVEKSRDMGATLFTVNFFVWAWIFIAGFIGSMVTRKEELVDSKKKKDTLFEKARIQITLLPKWMRPEGFDPRLDSSHMTLVNPANQSELTGEAPTTTVGRQGRATAMLADEFAHWPYEGIPQNVSMSMTCKSIIKVSSVFGLQNEFAREAHSGKANMFVMDWREHLWKDKRWYDGLAEGYAGAVMSKAAIAQEIDRDYTASQPGMVWPMYCEPYSVITYSELKAFFHGYGVKFPDDDDEHSDGRVRMPLDWNTGRANDRGATPGHRNFWLWSARPREHQPLNDTVFLYREWIAPIPTTYKYIADYVNEVEKPDREAGERMTLSINSHEAESERQTYSEEYGIVLEQWKTDAESGISDVGDFLTIKDTDKPNPFRPQLMGRTRLVIVTRDGQGELMQKSDGSYHCMMGTDFGGFVNLRRQIQGYHYSPEEAGKPVQKMRPEKKDDDGCFVAGTLIRTERGDVPIEQVTFEDKVWTRQGFQPCSGAQQTDIKPIFRLHVSDGRVLDGTGNHPVWVEGRGFYSLDSLRAGDILSACKVNDPFMNAKARWLSLMESATTGIRTRSSAVIEFIFRLITQRGDWDLLPIMSISGNPFTATYRPAITSIIRMTTRSTTTSRIWSALRFPSTCNTITAESQRQPEPHTWRLFDRWRRNGTGVPKAGNGTANTAKTYGKSVSLKIESVSIAGMLTRPKTAEGIDFVPSNAETGIVRDRREPLRRLFEVVLSVSNRFSRRIMGRRTVSLSVEFVEPTGKVMPVFNLSVYRQHEYFANGILVHNCDCLKASSARWGELIGEQTEEEKRRERLIKANPMLAPEYLDKVTGWEHSAGMFRRQQAFKSIQEEEDEDMPGSGSRVVDRRNYLRKHAARL